MRRRRQELVGKGNIHFTHPVSGAKNCAGEKKPPSWAAFFARTTSLGGVGHVLFGLEPADDLIRDLDQALEG
jgi:hypothetical protein